MYTHIHMHINICVCNESSYASTRLTHHFAFNLRRTSWLRESLLHERQLVDACIEAELCDREKATVSTVCSIDFAKSAHTRQICTHQTHDHSPRDGTAPHTNRLGHTNLQHTQICQAPHTATHTNTY